MAQLNKLHFDKGGSLIFDAEGVVTGVGKRNFADFHALYGQVCSNAISDDGDEEDRELPFTEVGPFEDVEAYFLHSLNKRDPEEEDSSFNQGALALLRLFTSWSLLDSGARQERDFVLSHPDFDYQNIFTSEDGTLTGIIDWDWVAAVPNSIGCLKFPDFLMRDYNQWIYEYDIKAGEPYENCDECSPEELSCYRATYAQFMENAIKSQDAAKVTRRSLVMDSLDVAAANPPSTIRNVGHIFKELARLPGADHEAESSDTESEISEEGDDGKKCTSVDDMSFEELLEEIDRLTTPSEMDTSYTGDNTHLMQSHSHSTQDSDKEKSTMVAVGESYGRRLGRLACDWGSKKARMAAECLHRQIPESQFKDSLVTVEATPTVFKESRRIRTVPVLYSLTKRNLKRAIEAMPFQKELGTTQSGGRERNSMVKNQIEAFIELTQKLLKKLIQSLHREPDKHDTKAQQISVDSNRDQCRAAQDAKCPTNEQKQMDSACRFIANLAKDNPQNDLSTYAQTAFVRFLVKSLRTEKEPEDALKGNREGFLSDQQAVVEGYRRQAVKGHAKLLKAVTEKETEVSLLEPSYFDVIFGNHNRFEETSDETENNEDYHSNKTPSVDISNNFTEQYCNATVRNEAANEISSNNHQACGSDGNQDEYERNRVRIMMKQPILDTVDAKQLILSNGGAKTHDGNDGESEESEVSEFKKSDNEDAEHDDEDLVTEATSQSDLEDLSDFDHDAGFGDSRSNGEEEGGAGDWKKQPQGGQEEKRKEEEADMGGFYMWDVCIALSQGTLDDRRLKRLREGFFALLDQSI